MDRTKKLLLSGTALALLVGFTTSGEAATLCVNPTGSDGCFSSIQGAMNGATAGDTVLVEEGTYDENVVINKSLTLQGAGEKKVTIMPAVLNPDCRTGGGGSLCGGAASNIILVQANDVTIDGLTLDGDNPSLTSSIIVGGADLDARNGIITNHLAGTFNNLSVSNVTVKNVYLRGIYASSGGTFNFHDNTVTNVQADPASIAMFNFGGSGMMANNTVDLANDAISSNHSRGVQFLNNTVTHSGSGLHTDNAGDGGGTADLIQGNTVKHCQSDGFGIFVFVPYLAPTVQDNEVHGCTVGLAAFGHGGAEPVTTVFSGNILNGSSASSSTPSNSFGLIVSTDILGFGHRDVSASFTGNVIRHFNTGVYVEQHCELFGSFFPTDCASGGGQATATLHNNVIKDNDTGANGLTGTVVNAQNNWWGCKKGPNQPGCDTAIGTVDFTPWLTKPPKLKD